MCDHIRSFLVNIRLVTIRFDVVSVHPRELLALKPANPSQMNVSTRQLLWCAQACKPCDQPFHSSPSGGLTLAYLDVGGRLPLLLVSVPLYPYPGRVLVRVFPFTPYAFTPIHLPIAFTLYPYPSEMGQKPYCGGIIWYLYSKCFVRPTFVHG